MAGILIVDDEPSVLKVLSSILEQEGHACVCAQTAEEALDLCSSSSVDVAVVDLRLGSGMDGLELLQHLRRRDPHLPVIMITAYGTVEVAVQAMKEGAFDFIRKPFKMEELISTVRNALRHKQVSEGAAVEAPGAPPVHFGLLVGESEQMHRVYTLIERVARTDATVFIEGESGTGKELVARAIHEQSRRRNGPWVALNCAAIPAPLLESEMFGHVAGAFTGATQDRDGLFLTADGGTLFLDEIGAMAPSLQGKLLRAIQESRIRRVGDTRDIPVDVRLIAATNESLEQKMERGEFREDLYYRISVIPIVLPPLRHRTEDVPLLVQHFCRRESERLGRAVTVSPKAMDMLTSYAWPGNVRELENAIACAAALSDDGVIRAGDLPPNVTGGVERGEVIDAETAVGRGQSLREFLRQKEKEYMGLILRKTGGNRARAAELLGISRATLYRKLEENEVS